MRMNKRLSLFEGKHFQGRWLCFWSLVMVSAVWHSAAFAEIIHFKDGRTVTGKILEKTSKSVKVDSQGLPVTYYLDEIEDIDGVKVEAKPAIASPSALPVAPQNSLGDKKELILKFIEVFGTRQAMTQNLESMLKTLPPNNPETKKIKENIKVEEIIERLVPIYDQHFTEEELKAYIDFYSSPQGRKLIDGIPLIMRQSVGVSAQYFQEKFPELKQK